MRHKLEFGAFKFLQWLLLLLPWGYVRRAGSALGFVSYYLMRKRRMITLDNLRNAFPERSEDELRTIAKGSFRSYGIALFEFFWFPNITHDLLDRVLQKKHLHVLKEYAESGKGVVLLTGHFGNWELLALGAAHLVQVSVAVIVQAQSNEYFDKEINKNRTMFGNRVVPMGISVREIIRTLHEGGVVAMATDQSGPREGVFVDFFGRSVATHQGPAVFGLKCKAPLLFCFSMRRPDGTYDVEFEEIPMSDLNAYNEANVLELTRRHTAVLESYIRKYPDQWLWIHRRWKHTWESVQAEDRAAAHG